MKKKAYVSSTSEDLHKYRLAINKTIKQLGYEDVAMEYYTTEGRPPLKRCQEDVEDCDIYICIVAWHYGSTPEGENKSFTEMEYDHARMHYKKMLIFLQDEKSLWHPNLMDAISKNELARRPDPASSIIDFRHKLEKQNVVAFFSSPDNLCQKLVISLASLERIMRPANISLLPEPMTSIKLLGRDETIEQLNSYYKNAETAVVTYIGEPGLGKSHVVREFLKNFNEDDISLKDPPNLKAQWIYGWSFLHQGGDHKQGLIMLEDSSTEFFVNVLKFYGFEDFPYSEEQQAELLVELLRTEETILILDGLDPLLEERKTDVLLKNIQDNLDELNKFLITSKKNDADGFLENIYELYKFLITSKKNDTEQYHIKHIINALINELKSLTDKVSDDKLVIKDRAIKIFLQKLCDETKKAEYHHKGLVIITARKAFSDLDAYLENHIYREISLQPLKYEDGAKLLKTIIMGYSSTEEETNTVVLEIETNFNSLIDKRRADFSNIKDKIDKVFGILSDEASGNPLGLTLLAKLLVQCSKIKKLNESSRKKDVDSLEKYKDIFNFERKNLAQNIIVKHYENWKASNDNGMARIRFLQILSLIGRPMQKEEFNFLLEVTKEKENFNKIEKKRTETDDIFKIFYDDDKLKNFLGPIIKLSEGNNEITESTGFKDLEEDLLCLGLIVKRNNFEWDIHHSLIRNFFTENFRAEKDEWLSAHAILSIYFEPTKTARRPGTQAELIPITRAIHHACVSENYQAAYRLYDKFVIRGDEGFITENLGLVAWDLSILSRFSFLNDFDTETDLSYDKLKSRTTEEIWRFLSKKAYFSDGSDNKLNGLTIDQLCDLLSRKAYCIELQGEFEKAIILRKTAIKLYKTSLHNTFHQKNDLEKAISECGLAHAYEKLTWLLARTVSLDKAKFNAGISFGWAKRANIKITKIPEEIQIEPDIKRIEEQRYINQATLGSIYHRLGDLKRAKNHFDEAEKFYFDKNTSISTDERKMASDKKLKNSFLHSEAGCRFCFLLIGMLHDMTLTSAERPSLPEIKDRKDYIDKWNEAEEKKQEYNRNYKQGELIGFHQRPPTFLIQAAHQLVIGLYFLAEYQEKRGSDNEKSAEEAFNVAIQLTQKAHNKSFQCQPLLARAMLWRYSKISSLALKDLEKVIELAGEIKLYQVDAELLKGNILLDQAFSFFKDKSKVKPFYRDKHELSRYQNLVENAECCLENLKENIKKLTYTLRYTDQELLKLRIDIAKLTIRCIEGIDKETLQNGIKNLEKKHEDIGIKKNNQPLNKLDYESVEEEIKHLRTDYNLEQ